MNPSAPLSQVVVVEFEGLGPVPFAAMLLADMGARVVRIARPAKSTVRQPATNPIDRGREVVELDLGSGPDRERARALIDEADILLEGFRPGVLERLGFAPDDLHARNPALVIGRMSAWGQDGPLANMPGHDLNILALTGALAAIGPTDRPAIPLNLIADYGGGALYLIAGVLAGLVSARSTGTGTTVDCAMSEGTLSLLSLHMQMWQSGRALLARESNLLDGGAPFYAVYECADGGFVAVAAIEPKFYANFLAVLGLTDAPDLAHQYDRQCWPEARARLDGVFAAQPRAYWASRFDGVEACVTPVLTIEEAMDLPQFRDRGAFVQAGQQFAPAPAPRFREATLNSPAKGIS